MRPFGCKVAPLHLFKQYMYPSIFLFSNKTSSLLLFSTFLQVILTYHLQKYASFRLPLISLGEGFSFFLHLVNYLMQRNRFLLPLDKSLLNSRPFLPRTQLARQMWCSRCKPRSSTDATRMLKVFHIASNAVYQSFFFKN